MAVPIRLAVRPIQSLRIERIPAQPIALERLSQAAPLLRLSGVSGPQGPIGPQGQSAEPQRVDFVNVATWIAAHSLGREPGVIVYLEGGEWVVGNVVATAINFTVTHAQPQTGFVLLI